GGPPDESVQVRAEETGSHAYECGSNNGQEQLDPHWKAGRDHRNGRSLCDGHIDDPALVKGIGNAGFLALSMVEEIALLVCFGGSQQITLNHRFSIYSQVLILKTA